MKIGVVELLRCILVHELRAGGGLHLLGAVEDAEILDHLHTRCEVLHLQILCREAVAGDLRPDDRHESNQDNKHETDDGTLLMEEARRHILPEGLGGEVAVDRDLAGIILPDEVTVDRDINIDRTSRLGCHALFFLSKHTYLPSFASLIRGSMMP